jgi:hypothetical protein
MTDATRLAADLNDGVVVYINGMRLNRLRALPQYLAAGLKAGKMLRELEQDPESGFLGYQPALMGLRHGAAIQYWRSLEDLHRFARERDGSHVPAWQWYNQTGNAKGGVGFWSETYVVDADHVETFFRNVDGVGIGEYVDLVPASDRPRRLGASTTGVPGGDGDASVEAAGDDASAPDA